MPFNGNGTFNRVYDWETDKINGVKIRADRMETEMDGFATGLSTCVTRDGQSPATANLPMGGFNHTGVSDGTARNHYASVAQVQDGDNTWGGTSIGAANTFEIGLTPSTPAYTAGMQVSFIAHQSNTGAATLEIDGLGAKAIQRAGAALVGNEILINTIVNVVYNGTSFQLIANSANSPTTTRGDLIVRGSAGDQRLAVGSSGSVLKSDGTDPSWGKIVLSNVDAALTPFFVPTGIIFDYAGTTEPTGYLFCYGQAISRTTYSALFAVIGTTYGNGDGATTFNLPDLRGRAVAGKDDMGGTSANRLTGQPGGVNGDNLGAAGGTETHSLTTAELATHNHFAGSARHAAGLGISEMIYGSTTTDLPGLATTILQGTAGAPATQPLTSSTGSGSAHNNVQPTIILNKIIKI